MRRSYSQSFHAESQGVTEKEAVLSPVAHQSLIRAKLIESCKDQCGQYYACDNVSDKKIDQALAQIARLLQLNTEPTRIPTIISSRF